MLNWQNSPSHQELKLKPALLSNHVCVTSVPRAGSDVMRQGMLELYRSKSLGIGVVWSREFQEEKREHRTISHLVN